MYRPPLMPQSPEMWRFPAVGVPHPQAMGLFAGRKGGDASVEGSTVTEQSWGSKGFRPRRGGPDDESTKLDSTSSGDGRNDSGANRGFCNMLAGQNPQTVETPKRDFIHVKARRGQATDSHSLAERERREKISERMKILQDLVPGCNKVIGKASILDEIINYIQALQHQVEFLSMKLEAVNAPLSTSIKVFPPRDVWYSAHKQRGSMSRIRGRGDGFKCRLAATLEELRRWKETTQPWIIRPLAKSPLSAPFALRTVDSGITSTSDEISLQLASLQPPPTKSLFNRYHFNLLQRA